MMGLTVTMVEIDMMFIIFITYVWINPYQYLLNQMNPPYTLDNLKK